MVVVQSFRDAMLGVSQREAYEFTRIHVFSPGTRSVPFRTPYFATTRIQRRHCTRIGYEETLRGHATRNASFLPEDSHHWQAHTPGPHVEDARRGR